MAYRRDELGKLLRIDPAGAAARLRAEFKEHGYNHGNVAAALGVDRSTLRRWRAQVMQAGFADPSRGKRAPRNNGEPRGYRSLVKTNPLGLAEKLGQMKAAGFGQERAAGKLKISLSRLKAWRTELRRMGYRDAYSRYE